MNEYHVEKLQMLCRICGNKIKLDKKRKPKKIEQFSELLAEYLDIHILDDKPDVHPKHLCEKCRKILLVIEKAIKQNKEYKPSICTYIFEPHHESCSICNLNFVGRPKVLRQLNQYNNTSTITIKPTLQTTQTSTEIPSVVFDFDSLTKFAEKLGYATIPSTDESLAFIIFHKTNIPFVQLRNLLTVNIAQNATWSVHVCAEEVTKNPTFSSFTDVLTVSTGKDLLEHCTKLVFCSGNNDFEGLCESRRQEGNMAKFTDRNKKVIASEVNDVICKVLSISSTVRHKDCHFIAKDSSICCEVCTGYRATLASQKWKMNNGKTMPINNIAVKPNHKTPHKFMDRNQLLSKLQGQRFENKNLRDQNAKLQETINTMIKETGVIAEDTLDSALKATIKEKGLEDFPEGSAIRLLFEEQVKQSSLKTSQQMRWHPLVIRWCLGIYHTSPSAYDFLRRSSFLKLPHKTTLLDYSIYTKPSSGFNPDVIKRLYEELGVEDMDENNKNVSLLFDEMKIQSELVYSKSTGKLIGFVELGSLDGEIDKLEQCCSGKTKEKELATSVLAFMVRGIYSNYQFTFAYFPTKSLSCEKIFPLAWNAVATLEMIGLKVRCFVCDGASSNRKFYKMHSTDGVSIPYFAINLCDQSRKIFFICDVPHLIKTVRNNWENSHGNRNSRNLMVSEYFQYCIHYIIFATLKSIKNIKT